MDIFVHILSGRYDMGYILRKMKFQTSVHFGSGSLAESECVVYADTLFSALCIEALQIGQEALLNRLVERAKEGKIAVSDAMPYLDKEYYIPKPMLHIQVNEDDERNDKKAAKALKYIPIDLLKEYLAGEMDCTFEVEKFRRLGSASVKTQAFVRGREETLPYSVGTFKFNENGGLYVCIYGEDEEDLCLADELLFSLQYSGLGGKRSNGFGRFIVLKEELPESMMKYLQNTDGKQFMTIACTLPGIWELEHSLCGASYQMLKRSGFIQSKNYANEYEKKKDQYIFKAGSCFINRFEGDIYLVGENGGHSVYRYAKPMFLGLQIVSNDL